MSVEGTDHSELLARLHGASLEVWECQATSQVRPRVRRRRLTRAGWNVISLPSQLSDDSGVWLVGTPELENAC